MPDIRLCHLCMTGYLCLFGITSRLKDSRQHILPVPFCFITIRIVHTYAFVNILFELTSGFILLAKTTDGIVFEWGLCK